MRLLIDRALSISPWRWVGPAAPSEVPDMWDHIWFLKESDKNFATGITVCG